MGFIYNQSYAELIGSKHPSAFGNRLKDVWSEVWPEVAPLIERTLAGEGVYREDLPLSILRNDRLETVYFTFSYSPLYDENEQVFGIHCAVMETTSRVVAARRQSVYHRLTSSLRELSSPLEIMDAASKLIGEHFAVARVGYAEIDKAVQRVHVEREWMNGAISSLAESRPLEVFGPRIIEELKQGRTLLLDDIAGHERSASYSEGNLSIGARSMIAVPLLEGNRLTAILYLHEEHPRAWTSEEVSLAEDVARFTWEAVKRTRVEQQLRDEMRILELINQTGRIVNSTLSLHRLLQSITDTATQLSGARFGAFFYMKKSDAGSAMTLYALSGATREDFEEPEQPRAAMLGSIFRREGPIRSDDVTTDARYGQDALHHGMLKHLPVRSYLAAPVILRSGEPVGGMLFGHPEPGVFTERTERIIMAVAAQASVAIDNAQLYEETKKSANERENLLKRERFARSKAERLNRMKDEFLALLAHELRNPLAPICSAAELLSFKYKTEPGVHLATSIISRQVEHMVRLVDDLLDVSRVTRGLVTLDKKAVDLHQVVAEALDQVRPLIDRKKHRLDIRVHDHPAFIHGDSTRLVQAVANILNNAAKYTNDGGTISVHLEAEEGGQRLTIQDNGIGMSSDLLPDVFDLFIQDTRALGRSQGGLGLGLPLVKKLVELHGGRVTARSEGLGKGSEFVVWLPSLMGGKEPSAIADNRDASSSHYLKEGGDSALKFMVVDDNMDAASLLAQLLQAHGHDVVVAYSGKEAIQQSEAIEKIDVFFLDIGLPDIDGYELVKQLKLHPKAANSVFIALTGYGQLADKERSTAAGFSHHLVKPINFNKITEILGKISPHGDPASINSTV